MTWIKVRDKRLRFALDMSHPSKPPIALFGYGFRPFFLAAGSVAPLLVLGWLMTLLGGRTACHYFDPLTWHAHEMLFGFAGAMVAGFLLTAVPNWTGTPAAHGLPLALLAALWMAGRLLPLFSDSPLVAVVDLAFLPALACLLLPPMLKRREIKSLVFAPILLGLWCGNALVHAQVLGGQPGLAQHGFHLALSLIVLMIVIIGGRVIPFFTRCALPQQAERQRRWPALEALCVLSTLMLPTFDLLPWWLVAAVCLSAALAHLVRMIGWCLPGVWRIPLLWVLYTGYGWLTVGFALRGLGAIGVLAPNLATHAFTAGAMAVVGLGIMARASLGHTGRALEPSRLTVASFVFANAAAAIRVGGPLLQLPTRLVLMGAGWMWTAAFVLFLIVYLPILTRPRADGKPG